MVEVTITADRLDVLAIAEAVRVLAARGHAVEPIAFARAVRVTRQTGQRGLLVSWRDET